jgi:hypothetical protein
MNAAGHRRVSSRGWKLLAVAVKIVLFATAVITMLAF